MSMSRDKHTCLNCRFYQKGAHYDCKENTDELVIYKDRPNFCDFFVLKEDALSTDSASAADSATDDAFPQKTSASRAEAEALFNSFFNN